MLRWLASEMKVGIGLAVGAVVVSVVFVAIWGPLYGTYGWRVIAVGVMVVEVIVLAMLEEFLRPQNPYRNLDPRFSYRDAGPTGKLDSGGSGWIWNSLPLVVLSAILLLTLAIA